MPVDTRGRSWDNPTVLSVLCDVVSVIGVVQLADVGDAAATTLASHTLHSFATGWSSSTTLPQVQQACC